MNTAVARRLALGDRVVWVGKSDHQPSGRAELEHAAARVLRLAIGLGLRQPREMPDRAATNPSLAGA